MSAAKKCLLLTNDVLSMNTSSKHSCKATVRVVLLKVAMNASLESKTCIHVRHRVSC